MPSQNSVWTVLKSVDPSVFPGVMRWGSHSQRSIATVHGSTMPRSGWVAICAIGVPPKGELVEAIYQAIDDGENFAAAIAPADRLDAAVDSDTSNYARNLAAIREEISEDPGHASEVRWGGLRRSLAVHDRNSRDLGSLLDAVATSDEIGIEMFQNTRPPVVREEVEALLDQRLHNYVASTASLIDHTRRLMSRYEDSHFLQEYERRRAPISDSPAARFIRDLRNFTTHRELPFVGFTVSLGLADNPTTTEFELNVELLLKWDRWSAPSRKLLNESGKTVALRDVLKEHVRLLSALYTWVFEQAECLHRYEYWLLEELKLEHDWILSGGQEGRPRKFSHSGRGL